LQDTGASPVDFDPSPTAVRYVVSVHDLAAVVDRQQRGSISTGTLTELMATPSRHGPGASARPLDEELMAWIAVLPDVVVKVGVPEADADAEWA
jgi:hypothetical protein